MGQTTCLRLLLSAILAFFLFNEANASLLFYRSPYTAHIAENYTFSFLFYIDGNESVAPICGITRGSASSNCLTSDAANAYLTGNFPGSSYFVILTKPQTRKDIELFGNPTFEVSLSIKSPVPIEVPVTPPPVMYPQSFAGMTTTSTSRPTTPAPFIRLPDYNVFINVFCCLPFAKHLEEYVNETAISLIPVPLQKANWSTEIDRATFRRFANPAHVERSTCDCDLLSNFCDTLCCCDNTCSLMEKDSFGCHGNFSKYPFDLPPPLPTPPYDCADLLTGNPLPYPAAATFNPFPHGWLCIMYKNTAYLGEHYTDLSYDTIDDMTYLEKNKKPPVGYSYYSKSEFLSKGYKQGIPLLAVTSKPASQDQTTTTKAPQSSGNVLQMQSLPLRAALFFPGRGPDGRCLRNVPIRFLSKSDTVYCSSQKLSTPEQCRTEFSQSLYTPAPNTIIARADRLGNTATLPRLPCNCLVQTSSTVQSVFKSCEFSNDTFCSPKSTSSPSSPSPFRCSCSATDTTSPGAVYNTNGDVQSWYCANAVKSVELRFGWSGNGTDATTSNISVALSDRISPGESIEQTFSVKFVKPAQSSNKGSSPPEGLWKWYRLGDPVKYLPEPSSDLSKGCGCMSPLAIRFGSGSYSGCSFRLAASNFEDCDNLRGMTISALRRMVPAELISKVAIPVYPGPVMPSFQRDTSQNNDWVKVAKLRRFPPIYPDCGASRSPLEVTTPLGRYPILYNLLDLKSRQAFSRRDSLTGATIPATFCGKQPSRLLGEISGAENATNRTAEILWAAACGTKRICERVPISIQMTIFRSISGARNGTLQHEIIGASLSFSVQDWFFDASQSQQQAYLSASIKFVSVPITPPKATFIEKLLDMSTAWDILYPIKAAAVDPDMARPIAAAAGIGLLLVGGLIIAPPK